MQPKLSIIIPVINEAEHLAAKLQALQKQRKQAELILVDGGSTDNSVIIAQPLVDQVVHSARGRARQMNAGAAQANADILLFLHADTCLPENALALITQAIAAGYHWGRFNVGFDSSKAVFKLIAFMMNQRSRLTGIATGDQALFMTRSAFEAVGKFPEIALMEDIAISKSLNKLGKPNCLSDRVITSARRWQKHGVVKTILFMWWLRLRYFFGADPAKLASRYYRGT
jgi:rSAM/selenodomain-associated transferase 2